jgi:hypothetical protein
LIYERIGKHEKRAGRESTIGFLDSLRYNYQADVRKSADEFNSEFIDEYNAEIEQADAAIEAGSFVNHDDVEQLFQIRHSS